jgi:hypothetical protein
MNELSEDEKTWISQVVHDQTLQATAKALAEAIEGEHVSSIVQALEVRLNNQVDNLMKFRFSSKKKSDQELLSIKRALFAELSIGQEQAKIISINARNKSR